MLRSAVGYEQKKGCLRTSVLFAADAGRWAEETVMRKYLLAEATMLQ